MCKSAEQWDELFLAQTEQRSKLLPCILISKLMILCPLPLVLWLNNTEQSLTLDTSLQIFINIDEVEVNVPPAPAAPSCPTLEAAISSFVRMDTSPLLSHSCPKLAV